METRVLVHLFIAAWFYGMAGWQLGRQEWGWVAFNVLFATLNLAAAFWEP